MPTTIRLKRVGRKKQPTFRIVVTDSARANSGPSIERLGLYNPRTDPSLIELNAARALFWLREGAEPSDTVRSLLRKTGVWEKFHAGVAPEQLDEAEVVLGPGPGERGTSRRPAPESAPAKARAAKVGTESAAVMETEVADATEEPTATADVEEEGGGAAEEAELRATESIAAEASIDPDASEEAEEEAADAEAEEEAADAEPAAEEPSAEEPAARAPGGTPATDKVKESSAVPDVEEGDEEEAEA